MDPDPKDRRLFELFTGAIRTGLEYVRLAETGKTHIGTHEGFPELRWHENGLPWVTAKVSFDCPKNYSDAIQGLYSIMYALLPGQSEPALDFCKEPSFCALAAYADSHQRLRSYLMMDKSDESRTARLLGVVADVLDRYVHTRKGSLDLDEGELLRVYLPIEDCLLSDVLPVDIVVPILFLKFEADNFDISEHIAVRKLTNDLHLARCWHGPWGDNSNSLVESAATHALFFSDLWIPNESWIGLGHIIMETGRYPVEVIDSLFASIRISTGYATGYAQLLTLPIDWASGYTADLTPLEGPSVKHYPPVFEQGAWNDDVPTVTSQDLERIKDAFLGLRQILEGAAARKVRVAMHRLNLCFMRETEEDGVIDAMIAVEALLSDGTQEMTHKVAMRLAGLYKLIDRSLSQRVFREMKRIYAFRSAIVHGATDTDKFRSLDREGKAVLAADAAAEHLRAAFDVLVRNPPLLEPGRIDTFLLTDNL